MKNFAIFDEASGRCVQTCTAPDIENASTAAGAGQVVVEVAEAFTGSNALLHKGAVRERPPALGPHYTFDVKAWRWIDSRTLQDLRDALWKRVKQWRTDAGRAAPLTTRFGAFQADEASVQAMTAKAAMLQAAALAGKAPSSVVWTLADNTAVTLTASELGEVIALALERDEAGRARERELRDQIKTATAAQLKKINWASRHGK